jgi:hypothetical protein
MKYNQAAKKAALGGTDIEDYDTWNKKQGAGVNEAPTKSESAEKFWDADTVKRYKAHVAEREKVGGKYPELDKWAPINKGKYIE